VWGEVGDLCSLKNMARLFLMGGGGGGGVWWRGGGGGGGGTGVGGGGDEKGKTRPNITSLKLHRVGGSNESLIRSF